MATNLLLFSGRNAGQQLGSTPRQALLRFVARSRLRKTPRSLLFPTDPTSWRSGLATTLLKLLFQRELGSLEANRVLAKLGSNTDHSLVSPLGCTRSDMTGETTR